MFLLTKEILDDNEKRLKEFENEKLIINLMIKSQNSKKDEIMDVLKKFIKYISGIETENIANEIAWTLDSIKASLVLYRMNIYFLNSFLTILENLNNIKEIDIDKFNKKYSELNKVILDNIIKIESILKEIIEKSFKIEFVEKNSSLKEDIIYPEATLIISEKEGKVILPFLIEDIIKENDDIDIKEIIEKKYIVPINSYKNTALSRFKEAFKLMRNKEKESWLSSISLSTELFFNYNLHPAIISACKNLDELDIYLDCLDENELDKFDCFKVVFDIPPVVVKNKK